MTITRGKRYRKDAKNLSEAPMSLADAVAKVKTFNTTKFDQTVQLIFWLGIDPKQSDQIIRGALSLPHGIGQQKKVIAFCEGADAEAAKQAGAIEVGVDELIAKVTGGWSDFDVAIASTKVMGKVGKLGRVLGPQGKMPSPKNGTVTADVATAVREFAAGKVEFKNDTGGNVHVVVGKVSFDAQKLIDNIDAVIAHIKKIKPVSSKGTYLKKISLHAAMSPGVLVTV
jgi:large subunit ribosomal protein L1